MPGFRRIKRGRKPRGLGKYGGVRWAGHSRRSAAAKRSAKLRRTRAKRRIATRGYVQKGVRFALTNKKNHTIYTSHSYRLDQDLSYRNAYFPLGTFNQSSVTDSPGVGQGGALPYREFMRISSQDAINPFNQDGMQHKTYREIVGKGLVLHRIKISGHCFIQPNEWMQNATGDNFTPYIDVYMFLVIDKAQKNAPMGYAGNHVLQNTHNKVDDFLVDKTKMWDNPFGFNKNADVLKNFDGHYMQTMMPVNTKRYKVLRMIKFRMNPGTMHKAAPTTYAGNIAGVGGFSYSFPGRPTYSNAGGFDQPFEMTLKFNRKKLKYLHDYRASHHSTYNGFDPGPETTATQNAPGPHGTGNDWRGDGDNPGQGNINHHYGVDDGHDGYRSDIAQGRNFFRQDASLSNNPLDAPSNFNPMLVACYSRPAPQQEATPLSDTPRAEGLCKLSFVSEVTYENPLHD